FRHLAIFVGGWDLEAVEAVCGGDGPLVAGTSLADKSLVHACAGVGSAVRFGMLETIREYGLERLVECGEETDARARHAAYYLALAERAEPELTGPGQARWYARLDGEYDNLRAVLAWACESGAVQTGLRIAVALWRYWDTRGHLREGRAWLERLLALGDGNDAIPMMVRAAALWAASVLALHAGNLRHARSWCE